MNPLPPQPPTNLLLPHPHKSSSEYTLHNPPEDGISALAFHPTDPTLLLASSWDRSARVYRTYTDNNHNHYREEKKNDNDGDGKGEKEKVGGDLTLSVVHAAPLLDVAFADHGSMGVTGGLDGTVNLLELETGYSRRIGTHGAAVKCVEYSQETGNIITGSWDKSVRFFDARASQPEQGRFLQPDKVYAMSIGGGGGSPSSAEKTSSSSYHLVVGMAGRAVFVYDMRNMQSTLQRRASPLKYQTRSIKCMPNGEGFAISSIEGRVALEYFDPDPTVQAKKYAFKCHRLNENNIHTIYPVNSLAFHPIYGTFASGGADGFVNIWDGTNRKRVRQFPRYPTGISALAFNCTGDRLAIASSYTWEEGEKDHPADAIYIRNVSESDVSPKGVSSSVQESG